MMKRKLNLKFRWFEILLGVYLFLFIFTMFNREFVFFGLDLRFVELPIGVLIIAINLLSKDHKPCTRKNDIVGRALIAFYIFVFISNIAWSWNDLTIFEKRFINEIILIINIFIGVLVFYLNKERLNGKIISYFGIAGCIVLALSMFLVSQGLSLGEISGTVGVTYQYESTDLVNNYNFFGGDARIAGYASDPNYATVALLIGIACVIRAIEKRWLKIALILVFLFAAGLSFSRTIAIVALPCVFYAWTMKRIKTEKTTTKVLINNIVLLSVMGVSFLVPFLKDLTSSLPVTLTTRFEMWRNASDLFMASPLIGNGLTSFRSFFATSHWYVQAHSTYWQVLSEFGIIGLFLYYRVASRALNMSINKPLNLFLTLVYIMWVATCESIALPFTVFIFYLFPIEYNKNDGCKQDRRALFFVNSLKNGGAEKVCVTMIDELERQGFGVDVVLANSGKVDAPRKKTNIIELGIGDGKIRRFIKALFSIPRINALLYENGDVYDLVTSHLPMSNFLTRLSIFSRDAIYVFHLKISKYVIGNKHFFSFFLALFFHARKVVTVSSGLRDEYVNEYHGKRKLVKAIYNPITVQDVECNNESIIPSEKYFLCVGRLCPQKRQDRVLKIFKEGNYYLNYILVFCGTGDTKKRLVKLASDLGIGDRVRFVGYQDNVFAWMKNAELLISASDMEAFPLNLVEALMLKTKVVAGDCEFGPNEILVGSYKRYLVRPKDDIRQYIKTINSALDYYPDEESIIIKKCAPNYVISKYLEFYQI